MGLVHAYRKEERKQNSVIYGAASDSLTFRFCLIDNEGNWSQSRLLEWQMGVKGRIHSVFRSFIRVSALSSPSTSLIKNLKHRKKVLASFGNPERTRKFEYALCSLELLEEDDETKIVSFAKIQIVKDGAAWMVNNSKELTVDSRRLKPGKKNLKECYSRAVVVGYEVASPGSRVLHSCAFPPLPTPLCPLPAIIEIPFSPALPSSYVHYKTLFTLAF